MESTLAQKTDLGLGIILIILVILLNPSMLEVAPAQFWTRSVFNAPDTTAGMP